MSTLELSRVSEVTGLCYFHLAPTPLYLTGSGLTGAAQFSAEFRIVNSPNDIRRLLSVLASRVAYPIVVNRREYDWSWK